jgi:hypothetical protein
MVTITFSVAKSEFADNLDATALALAIKTWLDACAVTTVYSLEIEHCRGFWVAILIFA